MRPSVEQIQKQEHLVPSEFSKVERALKALTPVKIGTIDSIVRTFVIVLSLTTSTKLHVSAKGLIVPYQHYSGSPRSIH
jgi:hypothetical protein